MDSKFPSKNNLQLNQSQPSLTLAWHSSAPACFNNEINCQAPKCEDSDILECFKINYLDQFKCNKILLMIPNRERHIQTES